MNLSRKEINDLGSTILSSNKKLLFVPTSLEKKRYYRRRSN